MPSATLPSPTHVCSSCGRPPESPYRRRDADAIVIEGCVSAAHDGHPDAWHLRPQAVAIRSRPKAWADLVEAAHG